MTVKGIPMMMMTRVTVPPPMRGRASLASSSAQSPPLARPHGTEPRPGVDLNHLQSGLVAPVDVALELPSAWIGIGRDHDEDAVAMDHHELALQCLGRRRARDLQHRNAPADDLKLHIAPPTRESGAIPPSSSAQRGTERAENMDPPSSDPSTTWHACAVQPEPSTSGGVLRTSHRCSLGRFGRPRQLRP
jgi:hypothetical protein